MKVWEKDREKLQILFYNIEDTAKKCIAFVGAGPSRSPPPEIPTWKETFHRLCERCEDLGFQEVADKQREIADVADYNSRFLTQCFEELRNKMGKPAYESEMKSILTPKNPGIPAAIEHLVTIPFDGIITTNLDELIEKAAIEAHRSGKRPDSLKMYTSSDGVVQESLARKHSWIWKIHGTVERPETWVFTASEYSKSIYANPEYCKALETVAQGARLVFLGFSGSDPDINRILSLLSHLFGGREDPHILLIHDSRKLNIHELANMNIHIIEYGGPSDHSALVNLLEEFPHFSSTSQAADDFDDSEYRRWLIDETDYIDIRGIGKGEEGVGAVALPILDMYTKLYVRANPTDLDLNEGRIRGGERVELAEMVEGTERLAIMGDPGSGKTTFLRFLARKQLRNPNGPLPIYLSLGDLYEFLTRQNLQYSPQIFLDFLTDLDTRFDLELTLTGLEKRMKNGQCWFLLDSLDELPSMTEREKMVHVIEQASSIWKSCKFVLTSRPLAMKGKSIPIGFKLVGIDQFHNEEIRSFLESWTRLLFPNASEDRRRRHCDSLLNMIKDRPEIHQLARNPVMLTSMAVIHYNERQLPEGRANLLEAVIQWLIHARERSRRSGCMPEGSKEEMYHKNEDIYRKIALAMFDIDGVRKNRVGRRWVAEKMTEYSDSDIEKALEFLRREETETGILVRRGEGDLAFWHLSFQEYLAAKEIAGKTDDEETGWWSILRENLDKTEWREVIYLVPACLNRLGSERVDLFLKRLVEHYMNADLPAKARGVALGGCILKDLQAYGYRPTNVPSWTRMLEKIEPIFELSGQEISLEDRHNAAVAYGMGGDNRLRNFDDTWVYLPGGTFNMGAQASSEFEPNYDQDATEWEGPVTKISLSQFEIRKYPVTVEEFGLFVLDGGYEEGIREYWTEEGWKWRCENDINLPRNWDIQLGFRNCPISGVSWFEANAYARWLTAGDVRDFVYRLPTEAEWEYAARRNTPPRQRFPWGNNLTKGEKAEANWHGCNLNKKTPIGIFPKSNTRDGITDMIGNVEEWCADSWSLNHKNYPRNGTARIVTKEERCVVRGGSTIRVSRLCRPSYRSSCYRGKQYPTIGFRLVRCRSEKINE